MSWQSLENSEAQAMIEKVKSFIMPGLFDLDSSEVQKSSLSFYNKFSLYRLSNYRTLPVFKMNYVGDGENFIYLDGSASAIYKSNELSGLHLDAGNIWEYLDYFFKHVASFEGGETRLIRQRSDLPPYKETFTADQEKEISRQISLINTSYDDQVQCWYARCILYHDSALVAADLTIDMQGHVCKRMSHLLFSAISAKSKKETENV